MHNIAVFGDNTHPAITECVKRVTMFAAQYGVRLHLPAGEFADRVISERDAACVWYGCSTLPGPQQKVPAPPPCAAITHHISAAADPRSMAELRLPTTEGLVVAWIAKPEHVRSVMLTHCQGALIVGDLEADVDALFACIVAGGGDRMPPHRFALFDWSDVPFAQTRTRHGPLFDRHAVRFGAAKLPDAFIYLLG